MEEHLADQLILPMSLAAGRSEMLAELSLHAQTAIEMARQWVPDASFQTKPVRAPRRRSRGRKIIRYHFAWNGCA